TLVRDLLTYSKLTRVDKPAETVNATESLEAALSNLAEIIAETGAHITTDPLPVVRVQATHLQQVFQNLIGNAIKYSHPDRSPVLRITAERQSGSWILSVADNGIGIAPQYKETIFGLFK